MTNPENVNTQMKVLRTETFKAGKVEINFTIFVQLNVGETLCRPKRVFHSH